MNDLRYGYLVCTNEIKPKFPPKVQAIWNNCGTHVTSMEAEQGAKEIEFFVEKMIKAIADALEREGVDGTTETLEMMGYIK